MGSKRELPKVGETEGSESDLAKATRLAVNKGVQDEALTDVSIDKFAADESLGAKAWSDGHKAEVKFLQAKLKT